MTIAVKQYIENDGTTAQVNSLSQQFSSLCSAGNVIVGFGTLSDYAGVHSNMGMEDSEGNSYTLQTEQNTSSSGGAQSVCAYTAVNIAGDASTANTCTQYFTGSGGNEDYQGVFVAEISGAATSGAIVGHSGNTQNALAPGTGNLTCGSITLTSAQVPALIIACAMNTSGSGTPVTPTVNTGTLVENVWSFGSGTNTGAVSVQRVTAAGTYTPAFNQASSASEDCAGVAIAVLEASTGASGTASVSEGADIAAASGAASTSGSAAVTEGHDTISGAGASSTAGTASVAESSDTVAASGGAGTTGTAAITGAADTVSGVGSAALLGSAAPVENADVISASGTPSTSGTAAIAEGHDSTSATGSSSTSGAAAITETAEVIAGAGVAGASGAAAIGEAADTVNASGVASSAGNGTIAESHDSASGSGTTAVSGTAAIHETADTVSGTGTASSIGGPSAPTVVKAFVTGTPTCAYVEINAPNPNGATVTQLTANAYSVATGDWVGSGSITPFTSPVSALSCRIDLDALPNESLYFTVTATNANGTSSASAQSNSVTPPAFVDSFNGTNAHFILCGGSVGGLSQYWSDAYSDGAYYRIVRPGDSTQSASSYTGSGALTGAANSVAPAYTAPAYPAGYGMTSQGMLELTPQTNGSGYAMQLYVLRDNTTYFGSANGSFNVSPFEYLEFLVFPVDTGTLGIPKCETTYSFPFFVSSHSSGNVYDQYQNWPAGGFVASSTGIFNESGGANYGWSTGGPTNGVNYVQDNGQTWNVGDRGLIQVGDQEIGNAITDISSYVISPSAGSLTVGQWNLVKVPLGSSGLNILGVDNSLLYKIHFNPAADNPGLTYICGLCFSTGSAGSKVGAAATTEAADAISAAGTASTTGAAAVTEAHDVVSGTAPSSTSGAASISESADVIAGGAGGGGSGAISEGADTVAGAGIVSGMAIRISNGKLVNQNGTAVLLRGASFSGLQNSVIDGSAPWGNDSGEPNWSLLVEWGLNVGRVTLNSQCFLGLTVADTTGSSGISGWTNVRTLNRATYIAAVDDAVRQIQAQGCFVILALDRSAPRFILNQQQYFLAASGPAPFANEDCDPAFWAAVGSRYGTQAVPQSGISNAGILFELVRQPYLDSVGQPNKLYNVAMGTGGIGAQFPNATQGGTNPIIAQQWNIAGYPQLLNAIRNVGAQNVCIVNGASKGQEISHCATYIPTDSAGQLVLGFQPYPNGTYPYSDGDVYPKTGTDPGSGTSAWDSSVKAAIAAGKIVIATEFGGHGGNALTSEPYVTYMANWFDTNHVGALGWQLNNPQPNSTASADDYLTGYASDGTTVQPMPGYGQVFFNWTDGGTTSTTGAAAVTEAPDIASGSGSTSTSGSASATEGADTASGAGSAATSGAAAAVESADSVSGSGAIQTAGSGTVSESADAVNGSGSAGAIGSGAANEGSDTVAGAGVASVAGTAGVIEAPDAISANGQSGITGAGLALESADTVTGAGVGSSTSSAAVDELDDTAAGAGAANSSGSATISEAPDNLAATGSTSTTGVGAAVEASDAISGEGNAFLQGTGAATEQTDIATGAGHGSTTGQGNTTEGPDVATGAATAANMGSGAASEQPDQAAGAGVGSASGAASITEKPDRVFGVGIAPGYIGTITVTQRFVITPYPVRIAVGSSTPRVIVN